MADAPDLFENKRVQLVQGLNSVAEAMRQCATIAEQYAKLLTDSPEKPSKRKAKAMEADGDGTTRKRRVKKPRDPNEPKRPASSYIMFQNDVRKELKSQFPDVSQADLLHMISRQWAEMTEEQKAVYSQANASAKERYSAEKAAYIATKQTGAQITPATPATPVTPAPPTRKIATMSKAPIPAAKATPKSAPEVISTPSESGSEESSSDDDDEGDDDDDDDEEEEEETRPAPKKAKKSPTTKTAAREKKQRK